MTPTIIHCEQGSPAWKQARCGHITASRCGDVIAATKRGEAAARANYRIEIISEILTGVPVEQYVTREMQWGIDQEPNARLAYELACGVMVESCGFAIHPTIKGFGASPDGFLGTDGLVQFKCPTTKTHLEWILAGVVPVEHCPQMLAELSVTGRAWCDFVSFDPRLPKHLQLFIVRFERIEKLVTEIEREVIHFIHEIGAVMAALPQSAGEPCEVIEIDQPTERRYLQ